MRHDECHEQEENLVLSNMKTKLSDIGWKTSIQIYIFAEALGAALKNVVGR
jgi:hypothetical protein